MQKEKQEQLNEIVKNSYERMADHFSATRSKMAAADFLWAANKISSRDKVLDAGCGNGRLLDYVLLTPENYLGLDNSNSLLQIAKERYPQFKFLKKDLNHLDEVTEKDFSVVFCSAVIIHIPSRANRLKLLENLYKLSNPEAKLIISAWKMKGRYYQSLKWKSFFKRLFSLRLSTWRDLVFPWLDQDGKAAGLRYYHYFSKKELRKELKKTGWQVTEKLDDKYNFWLVAEKK
jgi:2-polyprenyl-3-methyl-5-hydroxy-6-metoxy-1,4-benzoquinol methylase